MKIYFVRHGESVNNVTMHYTGWMDVPLTEKGEEDARRAGALLRGIRFDKIYSSDLSRAKRTCELALPGALYEETPLLREINVGTAQGRSYLGDDPGLKEFQRLYGGKQDYAMVGGESRREFFQRTRAFLEMAKDCGAGTVAAFCHAGVVHEVLDVIMEQDLPFAKTVVSNGSVSVVEWTGKYWRVCAWNVTERL